MYEESDSASFDKSNNRNNGHKETLNISPHIAAHKSTIGNSENTTTAVTILEDEERLIKSELQESVEQNHSFKISVPTSVGKGAVEAFATDEIAATLRVPSFSATQFLKSSTETLSVSPNKLVLTNNNAISSKHLTHIQPIENLTNSVIVAENSRTPITIYRLVEGTTLSTGVPILIAPVASNSHDHLGQGIDGFHDIQLSTNLSSSPATQGNSTQATSAYIIPEALNSNFIPITETVMSGKHTTNSDQLDCTAQDDNNYESKDLVRQAIQEAVTQNSQRTSSDFNYNADDIGGKYVLF